MRETFEEAYESFMKSLGDFAELAKTIGQAVVWLTVPFWVIPYAIIRKIKGDTND